MFAFRKIYKLWLFGVFQLVHYEVHSQSPTSCNCVTFLGSNNEYEYCPCARSWDEAQASCAQRGSSLAVITTDAEDGMIKSSLASQSAPDVWIGGTKTFKGWHWVTSGQLIQHQGCYQPDANHVTKFTLSDMTVEKCLEECGNLRYEFGGIENGQTCICSTSISNLTIAGGCRRRCFGNITQVCGGPTSVYWWAVKGSRTNWFESGEPSTGTFSSTEECLAAKCTLTNRGGEWSWGPYNCLSEYGYVCEYVKDRSGGCNLGRLGLVETEDSCLEIFTTNFTTWYRSRAICQRNGGRLVVGTSNDVLLKLKEHLDCTKQPFWIGASLTELKWLSGDAVIYTGWSINNPASASSHGCFSMLGASSHTWAVADCASNKAFLCQKGIEILNTTTALPPIARTTTTPTTTTTTTPTTTTTTPTTTTTTPTTTTTTPTTTTTTLTTTTTTLTTTPVAPTTAISSSTTTSNLRPSSSTTMTQVVPISTSGVTRVTTQTTNQGTTSGTRSVSSSSTSRTQETSSTVTSPSSALTTTSTEQAKVTTEVDSNVTETALNPETQSSGLADNLAGLILIIIGGLLVLICFSLGVGGVVKRCTEKRANKKLENAGIFVKDEDFSYVQTINDSGNTKPQQWKGRKKKNKRLASSKDKSLEKYNAIDIEDNNERESTDPKLGVPTTTDTDDKQHDDDSVKKDNTGSMQRQESTPSDLLRRSIDGASHTGSEASQDIIAANRTILPVYDDSGLELDDSPHNSGFIVPIGDAVYAPPNRYTSFA